MRVSWKRGGEGDIVEVRELHVTLSSTVAFPPGCPAEGTLEAATPMAFTLKVAGSRKEGDRYIVRGRLVSATVALREAFAGATTALG